MNWSIVWVIVRRELVNSMGYREGGGGGVSSECRRSSCSSIDCGIFRRWCTVDTTGL